jgi:DNA-binding CsgD family transcriptional regulator
MIQNQEGDAGVNPTTAAAAGAETGDATAAGCAPGGKIRLRDVRAIFRLVGDIRERGADPDAWRPHMVSAIRRLLKAEIVVSSELHLRRAGRHGPMRLLDIGWISDAEGNVVKVHCEREGERPEDFWLWAATGEPQQKSDAGHGQPSHDDAPAESKSEPELVPVRPMRKVYGGRSFILSQVALPHAGAVDQLGLHRAWGDDPFTTADLKLVRMLHVELGRLWRRDAIRRAQDPAAALPPRLAQTLEELLEGKSEKEIAGKLELSRHTIHNYVKALHQRFGVSSRGELLAKAGKEKGGFTPQLSLELPRRE